LLDGRDAISLFHIESGELELARVPIRPGDQHLVIQANNQSDQATEQEFHVQR